MAYLRVLLRARLDVGVVGFLPGLDVVVRLPRDECVQAEAVDRDAVALSPLLPEITGKERWIDQHVYPNGWSTTTLKHARRKVRDVAWGLARTSSAGENARIAFLICIILSILGG